MFNTRFLLWILFSILILSLPTQAHQGHQFRSLNPIASDKNDKQNLPDGAIPLQETQALSRSEVEPLVRDIVSKWNTGDMAATLSDQFYDKSRLLDVMDTGVPRDAKLRIQSIQSIQTLQQYQMPAENNRSNLVSIVSATARTQLEFNNSSGFQKRIGTNEFILKITRPVPPSL
ncbi:MAG: hypothetical protein DHS20C09_02440 [marine bacterium B5-7]|nr:MAG: hypothetical protein DHS20C09_02440 [marine bacterium B5-7]